MLVLILIGQVIAHSETGHALITNIAPLEGTRVSESVRYETYDNIIRHHCQVYGVDHELVKIVIEKESQFNPRAVSKSGAIGLMQLMPETAKILGVKDPYNPWENVKGGVKYLRNLFDMFDGELELVLAAYHAGPSLVRRLNRVPTIPATMEYVDYIVARYGAAKKSNPIYCSFTEDGGLLFTNLPK